MSKTVLITGATAGIGKATAQIFAKNNYRLIITGRREERLNAIVEELQTNHNIPVLPLVFDVRDQKAVVEAINGLSDEWEKIDILVNNAGLAVGKSPLQDTKIEDLERMIDTNIKGLLYVTHAILPIMIANKGGHIINLGSTAGREVYSGGHVYCATKHAVDALNKAMRIDLLKHNIRSTSIMPGLVETEFSIVRFDGDEEKAKAIYEGFQPLVADDIADTIYYAATRPPHVNITDLYLTPTAQANSYYLNREG